MKKMITLLLAGMLCVTAAACSGSQEIAKTDDTASADSAPITEAADLVVSEKYYNVYAYDAENPDQKAQDTVTVYEYEFDSQGHPTKTTEKVDGKVQNVRAMAYDAAGNVVTQTVYDPEGSKTYFYEFTYDEDNRKTKFVTHSIGSGIDSDITYSYDENGYLIAESYQTEGYSYTIEYENDEDGKKLASIQSDDNNIVYKTECEYDSDGRLNRETRSFGAGSGATISSIVEYEYDARGNAVKEVSYDADGTILYSYERVYKSVKELSGK